MDPWRLTGSPSFPSGPAGPRSPGTPLGPIGPPSPDGPLSPFNNKTRFQCHHLLRTQPQTEILAIQIRLI